MQPAQNTRSADVRRFEKVCEIIERFEGRSEKLIPILQAVQEEYRYLPQEVLAFVATRLRLPAAQVYGVATFYAHFTMSPKGKYVVKLCDGTACHVRRSHGILEALWRTLGLSDKKHTTDDMLFTVETVSCLGACGLAPVVLINEDVHGQMTPEGTVKLVEDILQREKETQQ